MPPVSVQFKNRTEAGRQLAERLKNYAQEECVVYALPRGGVVIGFEVAKALKAPLDILAVRKIGHPEFPEYAIAAVSKEGHLVKNEEAVKSVDKEIFNALVENEKAEAVRRYELYLRGIKTTEGRGKVAIVVDDGLATGLTARAAIQDVRERKPKKIVLAVPIAPDVATTAVIDGVDEFICLYPESNLVAIGLYYAEFAQVSDEEVIKLLRQANL